MVFPSLHKLCIQSLATQVGNGLQLEDVLDDDEKHELLTMIRLDNGDQTRTVIRELFKNWKFERVVIDSKLLKVIIANFEIDSLKQLTLKSIKKETLRDIQHQLMARYDMIIFVFDIVHLMDLFIKPNSREKLKYLDLSRSHIGLGRNIIERIAQFFPNITTLDLNQTKLTNRDFHAVCQFFPNVTNLSVFHNVFNDLSGISSLERLETLNMACCHIENDLKMREIFTLNNLRVLDISTIRNKLSHNFTHYISCNQALPKLEFIDVSFNEITEEQLKKLVTTHPTLLTVSLIGTPLQFRAQYEEYDVELMTVQNLEFCIRSMKRYSDKRTQQKTEIMYQLWIMLEENYESQDESLLNECLRELLNTEVYHYSSPPLRSVKCLLQLCRDGRIDKFSFDEVQKILSIFLNVCPSIWTWEDISDCIFSLQTSIWNCISGSQTIQTHYGNAELLCRRAANVMQRCSNTRLSCLELWNSSFNVMLSIFCRNPLKAIQYIRDDSNLIVQFLRHTNIMIRYNTASMVYCEFANALLLGSDDIINRGILTSYIGQLVEMSIQFQANRLQRIKVYIQNLIDSNRLVLNLFFYDHLFGKLTDMIKIRGSGAQKLAVMIFCWLKQHGERAAQNLTPANFFQMELKATPIINAISWYQPTGDNVLDIYKYLVRGRGEVEEWARWVMANAVEAQPAMDAQPVVERN